VTRRIVVSIAAVLLALSLAASWVLADRNAACAREGAVFDLRSWRCLKAPPAILQRDLERV
jgi:hypothetical protein